MRRKYRRLASATLAALIALAVSMGMGGCATTSSANQTSESPKPAVAEASYGPQSEAVRKELTDAAAKLPSMVDLRDLDGINYVTPVKLQYPYASCWTFGIAGAAEISFLHDNGLGVPAGTPNDIIDFSEKYISWFTRHAITKDEVRKGWVRASQVGEGTDLSVAEEEYVNIAYTLGGDAKYEHVNYDQYDLLMTADYEATTGTTEIKSANVFDAEEDEYLFQISTLSIAPHTTVHYEIYKDVKDGDPCSGTPLEEGDSFKEYGGYQRIDLQNEYFLKKGDKYSVVITQSYEGEDGVTYAAPYAKFGNANLMFGVVGSKLKGIINQGESLLYADGKWTDMYDLKDGLREAVAKEALGEDIENSTLASLFPNGIDDFVVDNYPIKAYLVPADAHDE